MFLGGVNPVVNLSVLKVRPPHVVTPSMVNAQLAFSSSTSSSLPLSMQQEKKCQQQLLYDYLPPLLALPHIDNDGSSSLPLPFSAEKMLEKYAKRQDNYIARVGWWPDGSIMVQITNRTQSCLQLLRVEVDAPHSCEVMLVEKAPPSAWINLHDLLYCMSTSYRLSSSLCSDSRGGDDFYFVWGSERTGFMQLYMYRYDPLLGAAILVTQDEKNEGEDGVTDKGENRNCNCIGGGGEWVVDSIAAVDEERDLVYFSSSEANPTEKHLYVSSLLSTPSMGGGGRVRLTHRPGWHEVTVHTARMLCVDVFSSTSSPPAMSIFRLSAADLIPTAAVAVSSSLCFGSEEGELGVVEVVSNNPASASTSTPAPVCFANSRSFSLLPLLTEPQFYHIEVPYIRGGLHCCVYKPNPAIHGKGPYPCVVSCYGGPHVQIVTNTWVSEGVYSEYVGDLL